MKTNGPGAKGLLLPGKENQDVLTKGKAGGIQRKSAAAPIESAGNSFEVLSTKHAASHNSGLKQSPV